MPDLVDPLCDFGVRADEVRTWPHGELRRRAPVQIRLRHADFVQPTIHLHKMNNHESVHINKTKDKIRDADKGHI